MSFHSPTPRGWHRKLIIGFVLLAAVLMLLFLGASLRQTGTASAVPEATPLANSYLPAVQNAAPLTPHVVLNEVMYWPASGELEWVEIYNDTTAAVSLANWQVTNISGTNSTTLPNWTLPTDSYLVVYFGSGSNDNDFSDGAGAYYTGGTTSFLADTEDGVALYSGSPSASTSVDFVAYSASGSHSGGTAMTHAVNASAWTNGDFFATVEEENFFLTGVAAEGVSIGRDKDSTDTNSSADWDSPGGRDAIAETPGAVNQHDMEPTVGGGPLPPPTGTMTNSWTVMVFMDARDAGLRPWQLRDINLMERSGSDDNVNIVVQVGPYPSGNSYRLYIEQDSEMGDIDSPVELVPAADETNPGDPDAIADFVTWAKTEYPAQRYSIILNGHGNGWKGTMLAGSGQDFLTMGELKTALGALGQKFDNLLFYSCLMGQVEVAYQVRTVAETMVASEEITWMAFPWRTFLDDLKTNTTWTAADYANNAAEDFANKLKALKLNSYTMASVSTDGVANDLRTPLNSFASTLRQDVEEIKMRDDHTDNSQLVIKHQVLEQAEWFLDRNFLDLTHIAELAQGQPLLAAANAPAVITAMTEGGAVILWEDHGPGHPNANGLSVYFPHDLNGRDHCKFTRCRPFVERGGQTLLGWVDNVYDDPTPSEHLYSLDAAIRIPSIAGDDHALPQLPNFDFVSDHTWDEFLHRYYKPVADGCIRHGGGCQSFVIVPVGTSVTLSGLGSSDSDGPEDDNAPSAGSPEFALGPRIGQGNDVPAHTDNSAVHWYWDLDTTIDNPAPLPNYQEGVLYPACTDEDCDRDENDSTDDDPDAVGRTVGYTCNEPGFFPFNLTVWDEHHDLERMHEENLNHNNGRHWLHFNVDSDAPTLVCITDPDTPIKKPDRDVAIPGDIIRYAIYIPAPEGTTGSADVTMTDQLSELTELLPDSLECDGTCSYDPAAKTISFSGSVDAGSSVSVNYEVQVPEEIPVPECPPEIINRATVNDGVTVHQLEAVVQLEVPCTQTQFIDLSTLPPGPIAPGTVLTASSYITMNNAITASGTITLRFLTQEELGYPDTPQYNFEPTSNQLQMIGGVAADVREFAAVSPVTNVQTDLLITANAPGVIQLSGFVGLSAVASDQNTQTGAAVSETLFIDTASTPIDGFALAVIDPTDGNMIVSSQWGWQFEVFQEP